MKNRPNHIANLGFFVLLVALLALPVGSLWFGGTSPANHATVLSGKDVRSVEEDMDLNSAMETTDTGKITVPFFR